MIEIRGNYIELNVVNMVSRKTHLEWFNLDKIDRIKKHRTIPEFTGVADVVGWTYVKHDVYDILGAIEIYKTGKTQTIKHEPGSINVIDLD